MQQYQGGDWRVRQVGGGRACAPSHCLLCEDCTAAPFSSHSQIKGLEFLSLTGLLRVFCNFTLSLSCTWGRVPGTFCKKRSNVLKDALPTCAVQHPGMQRASVPTAVFAQSSVTPGAGHQPFLYLVFSQQHLILKIFFQLKL